MHYVALFESLNCFKKSHVFLTIFSVCRDLGWVFRLFFPVCPKNIQTNRFFLPRPARHALPLQGPPPEVPPSPESQIGLKSLRFKIALITSKDL